MRGSRWWSLSALGVLAICLQGAAGCGGGGGDADAGPTNGDGGAIDANSQGGDGGVILSAQWDPAFGYPGVTQADGAPGIVYAIAIDGDDVYIGGDFTNAPGIVVNNVLRWNQNTGQWSALGAGVNGIIRAIAASNGNVYVGGEFSQAGGVAASRVAMWNGASWAAMGGGMDDVVRALVVDSAGTVYAGGDFLNADGGQADHIASWDGSAWSMLGLGSNNGTDGPVKALLVDGTDLYVGGDFSEVGGVVAAQNVGSYINGMWGALGTGLLADDIRALAWRNNSPGGVLLATGQWFDQSTIVASYTVSTQQWSQTPQSLVMGWGNAITSMAAGAPFVGGRLRWNANNAVSGLFRDDQFHVSTPSDVHAVANANDVIFVGGSLTEAPIDGVGDEFVYIFQGNRYAVAGMFRIHTSGRADDYRRVSMLGPGAYGNTRQVRVIGNNLYVVGERMSAGNEPSGCIFRMDLGSRTWTSFTDPDPDSQFNTAACTKVAIGGNDLYVERDSFDVWKLDPVTGGWSFAFAPNGEIEDMLTDSSGRLYVVGRFTSLTRADGPNVAATNGAVLDNGAWTALPDFPESMQRIHRIVESESGEIYVAVERTAGGNRVYKLSNTSWELIPGDFNGGVAALATHGGMLYVGGNFSHIGAQQVNHIARWNGSGWEPLGTGVTENQAVALVAHISIGPTGNLYAGGRFTEAGGVPSDGFAMWNGTTWADIPGPGGFVSFVALDGEVFVVGWKGDLGDGVPMVGMGRWVE